MTKIQYYVSNESNCNPQRQLQLDYCYNMQHEKRGLALIFNHEIFASQRPRRGTNIDRDRLRETFSLFDFDVEIHEDQTKSQVLRILENGKKCFCFKTFLDFHCNYYICFFLSCC